jgi:cell division cycle 2-like
LATFKLNLQQPYNYLRQKMQQENKTHYISDLGVDLLNRCLAYDPCKRLSAEKAIQHGWFKEEPLPKDPTKFPIWPSLSELERKRRTRTHSDYESSENNKKYKLIVE